MEKVFLSTLLELRAITKESPLPAFKDVRAKISLSEIVFISRLELGHKVLTPKMKRKLGVTDFVSEKMAVENALISINRS